MANEAILRDRLADPIDFTVADGTGIEKGALLELADPRTAKAVTGDDVVLAGIAAREKVASDGVTRLAVFTKGIFDMVASGAIAVGRPVSAESDTANTVHQAPANLSGAQILGYALETATNNETFQVYVNVGGYGG